MSQPIQSQLAAALLVALAAPAALADDADQGTEAEHPLQGVSLGLGAGTAYNGRGMNAYQSTSQQDPHAFLMPSVAWAHEGSGLELGWQAAFQVNGALAGTHIKEGVSAEQDFYAAYTRALGERGLSAGAGLMLCTFPLASKPEADAEVPLYAEPWLKLGYEGALEGSLTVLYSHGVQSALSEARYLYVHPRLAKTVPLGARVALSGAAAFGLKIFGEEVNDNTLDASVSLAAPIEAWSGLTLTPSLNWAWTNLSEQTFTEEQFAWGQLDAGFSF